MKIFMLVFSIVLTLFFGAYMVLLLSFRMFEGRHVWVPAVVVLFIYYSVKKAKELRKESKKNKK